MKCAGPAFRERSHPLHDTGVHRVLDTGEGSGLDDPGLLGARGGARRDALRDHAESGGDGDSNHGY